MTKQKIAEFENLARSMVGDGEKPDVYFVTIKGVVVTITRDLPTAYKQWRELSANVDVETALEDRLIGTIASVQPVEDGAKELIKLDDSKTFHLKTEYYQ